MTRLSAGADLNAAIGPVCAAEPRMHAFRNLPEIAGRGKESRRDVEA